MKYVGMAWRALWGVPALAFLLIARVLAYIASPEAGQRFIRNLSRL